MRGKVAARGRSDTERLQTGELVYAGVRRTPLCALATELPFAVFPPAWPPRSLPRRSTSTSRSETLNPTRPISRQPTVGPPQSRPPVTAWHEWLVPTATVSRAQAALEFAQCRRPLSPRSARAGGPPGRGAHDRPRHRRGRRRVGRVSARAAWRQNCSSQMARSSV